MLTALSHCAVTFSHKRNKKLQGVNLQYKKIYWPEEKRWIRLRVSTKVRSVQALSPTSCSRAVGHHSSWDSLSRNEAGGNIGALACRIWLPSLHQAFMQE